MTKFHAKFLNEDFLRYAAECKRMASLAHNSEQEATQSTMTTAYLQSADRLSQIWANYYHTPKRYGTLATS